jgi:hypothetical protein
MFFQVVGKSKSGVPVIRKVESKYTTTYSDPSYITLTVELQLPVEFDEDSNLINVRWLPSVKKWGFTLNEHTKGTLSTHKEGLTFEIATYG